MIVCRFNLGEADERLVQDVDCVPDGYSDTVLCGIFDVYDVDAEF